MCPTQTTDVILICQYHVVVYNTKYLIYYKLIIRALLLFDKISIKGLINAQVVKSNFSTYVDSTFPCL